MSGLISNNTALNSRTGSLAMNPEASKSECMEKVHTKDSISVLGMECEPLYFNEKPAIVPMFRNNGG